MNSWSRTVLSKDRAIDNSRINLQTLNSCDTRPAFFQIYSSVHPHLLRVALLNLEQLPFNLPNSGEQSALLERRLEKRSSTAHAFMGVERGRKSVGWSALVELRVQEGRLRGRSFPEQRRSNAGKMQGAFPRLSEYQPCSGRLTPQSSPPNALNVAAGPVSVNTWLKCFSLSQS